MIFKGKRIRELEDKVEFMEKAMIHEIRMGIDTIRNHTIRDLYDQNKRLSKRVESNNQNIAVHKKQLKEIGRRMR